VGGNSKNPSNDDAGNLTDDGETCLFTYDYRNRIVEVKQKSNSALRAKYEYDGTQPKVPRKSRRVGTRKGHRRIRKIVYDTDGATELSDVWFTYDGWQFTRRSLGGGGLIEERNHNNSDLLLARYIYGGRYLDELIQEDRDNNSNGLFGNQGDYNLYACQDTQYNVVALTDLSGSRLERLWYESSGRPAGARMRRRVRRRVRGSRRRCRRGR
jgi:hypothetical protein